MLRVGIRLRPSAVKLRQAIARTKINRDYGSAELFALFPAPSDPMFAVLCLSGAQVAMGAFGRYAHPHSPKWQYSQVPSTIPTTRQIDNFYHHEFTERLPWSPTAVQEEHIHAVRGTVYIGVFSCLAGITPGGVLAYGLATALVLEVGVTCWDFVIEDSTRLRYPATERVTHTLMAINFGAILYAWLPIIVNDWGAANTGITLSSYGVFTPLYALCAGGLALFAVRDELASRRLRRCVAQVSIMDLNENMISIKVISLKVMYKECIGEAVWGIVFHPIDVTPCVMLQRITLRLRINRKRRCFGKM